MTRNPGIAMRTVLRAALLALALMAAVLAAIGPTPHDAVTMLADAPPPSAE
jgi:hypothetical protein